MNPSLAAPELADRQALIDQDFWQNVERARRLTPQERVHSAHEAFERAIRLMSDGLKHQFPDADVETIRRLRRERLAIIHRLERNGVAVGVDRPAGSALAE